MDFELDQLVADCRSALAADGSPRLVREVIARAISQPASIIKTLGEPARGELKALYRSPDLTILNIAWAPYMTLMPHNHNMWGIIGIYTGREDNIFWRRVPGRLEAAGAKALGQGDVEPLGRDIIHSVTNPIPRVTAAIHVYGGDFFAADRSEWDPETLCEQRWDPERAVCRFGEANRIML
jgi:predicted metal-dependent enzyme (double-stranded beta helix superfamily)